MDISHTDAIERIARVLAGRRLSINGEGQGRSVAAEVDATWRRHRDDAIAVLSALREPDQRMAACGDVETWSRMVRAALGEPVGAARREPRSWAPEGEIYQKPLG